MPNKALRPRETAAELCRSATTLQTSPRLAPSTACALSALSPRCPTRGTSCDGWRGKRSGCACAVRRVCMNMAWEAWLVRKFWRGSDCQEATGDGHWLTGRDTSKLSAGRRRRTACFRGPSSPDGFQASEGPRRHGTCFPPGRLFTPQTQEGFSSPPAWACAFDPRRGRC